MRREFKKQFTEGMITGKYEFLCGFVCQNRMSEQVVCWLQCMSSRVARIDCCDQGKNNRSPVSGYDCHISAIRPSLEDTLLVQAVRAQVGCLHLQLFTHAELIQT